MESRVGRSAPRREAGEGEGVAVVAYMLVCCGDRWLALRRATDRNKWPGLWEVPGGHSKPGEQPSEAARRECLEETGLDLEPTKLLYSADEPDMFGTGQTYSVRVFEANLRTPIDRAVVKLNKEHDAYQWLTTDDLPGPPAPVLQSIRSARKEVTA